jgi:hypothetical protein
MAWNQDFWKPNPMQAEFLSIPFTIKEGFYGGGAGSGKSDVLLVYGLMHNLHENPLFKQVFMRRTHPDLKKEILPRSREIYMRFGATFNKTDMVWTFPRVDQIGSGWMGNAGAQIFLAHCEEEKDVHNFDSMEISLFTPDELTNCTEYIYLYIAFERNRAPRGSGLPAITRAAGMPGGIGHTFCKRRFVDPYPKGGKVIVGKGGNKRLYVHATLMDNIDHIDPTYAQSLDGRPEAERKAKKFGDWSAYLGSVFEEFRDKKYPDEPENALHVIPPFEIPTWWPRFIVGDWGFAALCYIGFYAVSPTGRLYLYREISWTKTKIAEWGPVIKDYIDRENIEIVKFCQSAKQDRGLEHTVQQQIELAIGRPIELTGNSPGSRVATKMMLHEYLRWKPKPLLPPSEMPTYDEERALWIMRNRGLEEYKAYLSMFDPPEAETDIPKLQIFCCEEDGSTSEGLSIHHDHPNCCPLMIDSIKACSYDNKTKDGKPVEDVAEFEGDDPYDDIRYAVDTAEKFKSEAASRFKQLKREAAIIAQLQKTQDFTAYYRNMKTLESGENITVVRRFHKGKR